MKVHLALAAIALTSALSAQSGFPNGEARFHVFIEASRPRQAGQATVGLTVYEKSKVPIGVGFRMLGELPGIEHIYYEAGIRLPYASKFDSDLNITSTIRYNSRDVEFRYAYWSLEVAYLRHLRQGSTVAGHLDVRGESIGLNGPIRLSNGQVINLDSRVTYLRPWLRFSYSHQFRRGPSPYVGFDLGGTPLRTKQSVTDLRNDETLKSLGPSYSGSLYVGYRF